MRILEKHGTIGIFQFLATVGQKLVEVTYGLLIGTQVCSAHLGKSSVYTFQRIQVLAQSNFVRSEFSTLVSGQNRNFS